MSEASTRDRNFIGDKDKWLEKYWPSTLNDMTWKKRTHSQFNPTLEISALPKGGGGRFVPVGIVDGYPVGEGEDKNVFY